MHETHITGGGVALAASPKEDHDETDLMQLSPGPSSTPENIEFSPRFTL